MKQTIRQWPTVLLPSHRSYLDFILVTYVFFHFNLRLPVIAAGQDFMEMAVVSSFLRRSGAFFMRRTFGSDLLYWSVFSEYVQQHLTSGYAPVEFFIEGTRSRTAKSYHPKLGEVRLSVFHPHLVSCGYAYTCMQHCHVRTCVPMVCTLFVNILLFYDIGSKLFNCFKRDNGFYYDMYCGLQY